MCRGITNESKAATGTGRSRQREYRKSRVFTQSMRELPLWLTSSGILRVLPLLFISVWLTTFLFSTLVGLRFCLSIRFDSIGSRDNLSELSLTLCLNHSFQWSLQSISPTIAKSCRQRCCTSTTTNPYHEYTNKRGTTSRKTHSATEIQEIAFKYRERESQSLERPIKKCKDKGNG